MTIDELKDLSEFVLKSGVETLQKKHGDLCARFHLVKADGGLDIVFIEGDLINQPTAKEIMAREIRRRAAAGELQAVVLLSDVFVGRMSEQNEQIRRRLGLNVEQSAELGLCKRQEAVMVSLDSPFYRRIVTQDYTRRGREIELGERKEMDDTKPGSRASGRFMSFFNHEAARV